MFFPIDTYRILSFDPGSYFLGMAVSDLNKDLTLSVLHAETFKVERAIDIDSHDCALYGERYMRIRAISEYVNKCFETWYPSASVIELPYLGKQASAFGSLKEIVLTLRNACINANPNRHPFLYEPSVIKKAAQVSGKSGDKSLMLKAVTTLPDLDISNIDVQQLDEHSIDAILIGYAHLKLGITRKGVPNETGKKSKPSK